MKIAVAGGTGFVGRHLTAYLRGQGDEVVLISRSNKGSEGNGIPVLTWEELAASQDRLEGVDGIVNLAGASINQRWTDEAKRQILGSRLDTVERLAHIVNRLQTKPRVVISGSAMAIYGTSESDTYDEQSPERVVDFLSGVVHKWEAAANQIRGPRLVKLRTGVVLGKDGGALPKMALPYRLGVGGRIGNGKQWLSWIHIEDMVRLIRFCLEREEISGPVNATAPHPATNEQFGEAISKAMGRPNWLPVPSIAFKLAFGEMSELLLSGQRVLPRAAMEHGFAYRYETIGRALTNLYGQK